MHLKVVLQGDWGHHTSTMYSSAKEFWELRHLLDAAEVAIAADIAQVGSRHWPEVEAILCNFWCRAPDIDGTTVKHYRKDRVLEASICLEGQSFRSRANEARCNAFFFRGLTLAAEGFRKFGRDGAEIEAIRDRHFKQPEGGGDF